MEFYEVIDKRRTTREFLDKDVDPEAIHRILEAAYKAPTWNHNPNWHFIILRMPEEKEAILAEAKKAADHFDAEKYLNVPRPYPITLGQKMFAHAMPRQYSMLKSAPYVILPVFRSKDVSGGSFSKLNPFATIWASIENLFLAAAAEGLACSMRIPTNEEHDTIKKKLKVPATYMIPVLIGVGYSDPEEAELEKKPVNWDKQIHYGRWR